MRDDKMIEKIKKIMVFFGINQKQFAEKIGMSQVAVSRYLSGKRKITIEFVINVSNVFDVSLDWLLKSNKI